MSPGEEQLTRDTAEEVVPRRLYIKKEDLDKLGYSAGSPGCRSVLRGGARQAHTEACRKRLEAELEGTERAERSKRKGHEFLEGALAKSDAKRKMDVERKQMDQHDGATGAELSHETLPDANQ